MTAGEDLGPVIGIVGPVSLAAFRDHLPAGCLDGDVPLGLGGTAVNPIVVELLRRGRRVVVFSLDESIADERIFEGERLKICVGPYTRHRGRVYFRKERGYLLDAIRRERPDVLSAHWTYEFALAAIVSGIPHVVTAHDAPWTILRLNFIPYRMVRTVMAYHACWRARRLVAVSPHIARHLRRWGFHAGPIDVIANGLPDDPARTRRDRAPDGAFRFAGIFSGGWDGVKNGRTLLAAFAILRRSQPIARLAMIGGQCEVDGPAARWAADNGIADGIDFLGPMPHAEVMDFLCRRVDILVHPSIEESFGLPLIEAMAVGVPVIAGRYSGAVSWVLDDGAYGVLVDVRSASALVAAMHSLYRDDCGRRAMAGRASVMVRERFHIRAVVDRYEAVFAELLKPAVKSLEGARSV